MSRKRFGRRSPERGGLTALIYSDFTVAAVVAGFCAYAYYLSTRIGTVPDSLAQGMQPASYPQGVILVILLLVIGMLVESRTRETHIPEPVPALSYATMAAMIVSLALATWIDFFVGMIFFVVLCVPLWGMRRYLATFAYALVLAAVLYLMFGTFLRVRFPEGVLVNLLP
ncbi:tripartite tricarboxylate transporter TctB family protein [Roseitranquillus sediminis]|uniref:tripartite tricarboxylate transporter TctB family protein n=1 Tax=Roseitranquillus sediminis TaxID=2809051 RepID=UPI001D0C51AD|nr:tripartite tricarboxylate transporter TctB family protein [Roseitranquillus sediminis]MBM9595479.1 tripartite tricarboxylate transporter TctB family protein [Roseitranquillus sediminis]